MAFAARERIFAQAPEYWNGRRTEHCYSTGSCQRYVQRNCSELLLDRGFAQASSGRNYRPTLLLLTSEVE